MDESSFVSELKTSIQRAVAAAEESPDVRKMEPALVDIAQHVTDHSDFTSVADKVLAELVPRLGETPGPVGILDLLEYCVHVLDLPRVLEEAESLRMTSRIAYEAGPSGRPWEHARRCEDVLEAAQPDWDGRDMYRSLSG
jgi:hypothetical protein